MKKVMLVLLIVVAFLVGYVYSGDLSQQFSEEFQAVDYDLNSITVIDDNSYLTFSEPSLKEPRDIAIFDYTGNSCVFKVVEANVIECDCTLGEFIKVMYNSMTNTDSNDVILKFTDGVPEVVD